MRLACPNCGSLLDRSEGTWPCSGCGSRFRSLRGIPDLRVADDEFLPSAEDWSIAIQLCDQFNRLDFLGLLDLYYELLGDVPTDLRRRQVDHIHSAPDRADQWMDVLGRAGQTGPILDLGCGPGAFLATGIGARSGPIVGLDIAMRWLILARKRLDEEGAPDVVLVCGCAENLPFEDGSFSSVVGGDVIEHVRDAEAVLSELHRVLRPGGRAILATPNRFSLSLEPHVNVWGVGFLPRRWMAPYVRFVRKADFRAIHTRGWLSWTSLIERSPFRTGDVSAPILPEDSLRGAPLIKRWLGRIYNGVVGTRMGQFAARLAGPLFHIAIERPTGPGRGPSPAIRRPSRPSATRRSPARMRGSGRRGAS